MSVALDASATLARCFEDERTDAVMVVIETVIREGAVAPAIWRMEVANALLANVRRHRLTADDRDGLLAYLAKLMIEIDVETDQQVWPASVRLADRHGLTLYDASYLELAIRRSLPLATLDRKLRQAALSENIVVLGL